MTKAATQISSQLLHNFLSVALPSSASAIPQITPALNGLFQATISINSSTKASGTGRSIAVARQNARLDATLKLLPMLKPNVTQLDKKVAKRLQEIEMMLDSCALGNESQEKTEEEDNSFQKQDDDDSNALESTSRVEFVDVLQAEQFINRFCTGNAVEYPIVSAFRLGNSSPKSIAKASINLPAECTKNGKPKMLSVTAEIEFPDVKAANSAVKQQARIKLANALVLELNENALEKSKPSMEQDRNPTLSVELSNEQREALDAFIQKWKWEFSDAPSPFEQRDFFGEGKRIGNASEMKETHLKENVISQCNSINPPPNASKSLPVYQHYSQIIQSIQNSQVTLITGATGSGKTTQIPQYILHAFPNSHLLMTQPRRVAAFAAAERISQELKEPLGFRVGYAMRFQSKPPTNSRESLVVCTSGVLLKQLASSSCSLSSKITHIILDEVHERDVTTDLLLARLKELLKARRNSLRLICMSATVVAEKIARYFSQDGISVAEAFQVPGTLHPIKEHFLPDILSLLNIHCSFPSTSSIKSLPSWMDEASKRFLADPSHPQAPVPHALIAHLTAHRVKNLEKNGISGSILVFLPGIEDIGEVKKILFTLPVRQSSVHTLHSALGFDAGQAKELFFSSSSSSKDDQSSMGNIRIILATNIAESSVTIPDAVCVVDAGRARILRYCHTSRISRLQTQWISQANYKQRKGRAGRTRPGEYHFLGVKSTLESAPQSVDPEVNRVCLQSVALTVKKLFGGEESIIDQIADSNMAQSNFDQSVHSNRAQSHIITEKPIFYPPSIEQLLGKLIDPPEPQAVRKAVAHLKLLGALDEEERLVGRFGAVLSELPVDPAMGKLLIAGALFGKLDQALTLVASLSERIFRPVMINQGASSFGQGRGGFMNHSKSSFTASQQLKVSSLLSSPPPQAHNEEFNENEEDEEADEDIEDSTQTVVELPSRSTHLGTCSIYYQYVSSVNRQSFCWEFNLNSEAMKRMMQVRRDLQTQLEENGLGNGKMMMMPLNEDNSKYNQDSFNEARSSIFDSESSSNSKSQEQSPLFSLMILMANYPNVAWKRAGRRGPICTKSQGFAGISGCPSSQMRKALSEPGLFTFDSIIDTQSGRPLLNRVTPITPLQLLAVAPPLSRGFGGDRRAVTIDGWLRVECGDGNDVGLVFALGDLLRRYVRGMTFNKEFVGELEHVLEICSQNEKK